MKENIVTIVLLLCLVVLGGWFVLSDKTISSSERATVDLPATSLEEAEPTSGLGFKIPALMSPALKALAAEAVLLDQNESVESNMFFYAGLYENFGTAEDLGAEMAKHDVAVMTHAYEARNGAVHWTNGNCVDYTDELLIESIKVARSINPDLEIYGYISATADNGECYDPAGGPQLTCPNGICSDVIAWVNRWLEVEKESGEYLDGIYVDLFGTQFIGPVVRDNVLSYIHLVGKKSMLNVMFGGLEIFFALNSPHFDPDKDSLLFEGFYVADGGYWGPNAVNNGLLAEIYLNPENIRWVVLSTEKGGSDYVCDSQNANVARGLFDQYGGWAFSYQSSDLGLVNKDVTQSCAR